LAISLSCINPQNLSGHVRHKAEERRVRFEGSRTHLKVGFSLLGHDAYLNVSNTGE
jgi:hypothetical protein